MRSRLGKSQDWDVAYMTLDGSFLVDDLELVLISRDLHFVDLVATGQQTSQNEPLFGTYWHYANNTKESSIRFPALRASASMVVGHVRVERHFYWIAGAFALQLATTLVWIAWLEAVVDRRMQRSHVETLKRIRTEMMELTER